MDYEEFALNVFQPVVESAMIVAAEYCNSTGRTIVVSKDIEMGMKFAAKNILGNCSGTLFPEISNDSDDDSDDMASLVSEDDIEETWSRYDGTDPQMVMVNDAYDSWDQWVPETQLGDALKSAIEKSIASV